MALIPDVSELAILRRAFSERLLLRLYQNSRIPKATDLTGDFEEVSRGGYEEIILNPSDQKWTQSPLCIAYPKKEFLFTGAAGRVYGYFVVWASDGILVAAERFPEGPYDVVGPSVSIEVEFALKLKRAS